MPAPTGWASYLPLCTPSDVRGWKLTPEYALQLNAAPNTPIGVTVAGSTFTAGIEHRLETWTAVRLESSGTLPAPLVANTTYYARDVSSTTVFKVASVIGGAAITLTSAGSGQIAVRNYSLDDVIEAKISLSTGWLYDELLGMVIAKVTGMNLSTFLIFFPISDTAISFLSPIDKATIVLDNLLNPTKLKDAAVAYTLWAMAIDGEDRNQVQDQLGYEMHGPTKKRAEQKFAEELLRKKAALLTVSTANGADSLFNFDQLNAPVTVSLL